ncbi:MAG: lysophospholipid acyltransferase family protein [Deltaproteobacteria bacterium]|nr:lysophospholipid acyltransferase family protein [Deltaproteobacteria bacterium]MBW1952566.1 lysophospholipid acyltransferase family protein [Deltaproteobacteria bacterium]MBW1986133.1 lysophospholipid acyltransferase family protein [Deltaproteobacteria bacterium]MBW2134181.1 lysophospholipid acyltransferase family protein [Deltaproteobacteria bacterium]
MKVDSLLWNRLLPSLGVLLLRGIYQSCRQTTQGEEQEAQLLAQGTPILYTVWHCQLSYLLYYFRHRQGVVMASPSRDGKLIARVAQGLGFIVCQGSRHKGGLSALNIMADYIRRGHIAGLVADGSRGPARVAQKGPLVLARETQVPILPLAVASRRKIIFNSWDRFELTLPFSEVTLLFGAPLYIPPYDRGRRLEYWRQELEARLNYLFLKSHQQYQPI